MKHFAFSCCRSEPHPSLPIRISSVVLLVSYVVVQFSATTASKTIPISDPEKNKSQQIHPRVSPDMLPDAWEPNP
ncbi:hypothetical protein LY78DRAFT_663607 [Colletotrichum sublineola]|nr:hypothetical protein LY78DRAFT_663607 [Colletotrichum sublineola]